MASGVEKKVIKHLECAVCLERFKEPKMLSCQHSYCWQCLERLVTASGSGNYEITCPECRKTTKVPKGQICLLPTSFFINKLLSEFKGQSPTIPTCPEHEGEEFKLFCLSCDKLVCRDCALVDHRDHDCKFVNEVYSAEKEKIEKAVDESRARILDVETSLATIESQEDWAKMKFKEVSSEVDVFINGQIEALEKKRKSLKDELQKIAKVQKQHHEIQKNSFAASLGRAKTSVEFAEQILKKGNQVEVLAAKCEIIQQLSEMNSAAKKLQPRGMISYDMKTYLPLDDKVFLEKLAKITEYDDEYTVKMEERSFWRTFLKSKLPFYGSSNYTVAPFTSRLNQICCFKILRKHDMAAQIEPVSEVKVNIKNCSTKRVTSAAVEENLGGWFTFNCCFSHSGNYEIEVSVNGRYLKESPFKWVVRPPNTQN